MNKTILAIGIVLILVLISGLVEININHHIILPDTTSIQAIQHRFVNTQYPYVHTKTDIRLESELKDVSTIDKLDQLLVEANRGDLIVFHLAGYGGDGETMMLLINNLHMTRARTVMHVEASVYSAHAYIATQGDELIMEPYSVLMFHTISAYGYDCTQEQGLDRTLPKSLKCQQQIDSIVQQGNKLIQSIKVLTDGEKRAIMTGHDIYITADEYNRRQKGEVPITPEEPQVKIKIDLPKTISIIGFT